MDVDDASFKQPNLVLPKTEIAVKLESDDKKSGSGADKHKPKLN